MRKFLLSVLLLFATTFLAVPYAMAQNKVVLGVSLSSDTNPFYIAMRKGIEARVADLGWEVRFVTANEQVTAQVNGVQDLVAQKVNGIIISPIDEVATSAAYEAASKAGIPIISIGRHSRSPFESLHVIMDEVSIGREIAAWIAKAADGKGKVAVLAGPAGAATFKNLQQGFEEEIKKNSGMPIVYSRNLALTREQGLNQAEDVLVAHPDIRVIYCGNDEIALGAAQAVATAGKKANVIIAGMNGIPPAMKAVASGAIDLTIQLNPVAWGRLGVDTMDLWLKGKKPVGRVFYKHTLVDKSNVAALMPPPPAKN
ncbi:MAG: sugar ABC transporter substrate-binding protein [Xanthobacteraceae bacterium]|nr:MAG: sugar ABC transporter substrate-binding protein [Xanthobacteraceae bacterium]